MPSFLCKMVGKGVAMISSKNSSECVFPENVCGQQEHYFIRAPQLINNNKRLSEYSVLYFQTC